MHTIYFQYTVYSEHTTVHCAVKNVYCTTYNVQCTAYSVQLYTVYILTETSTVFLSYTGDECRMLSIQLSEQIKTQVKQELAFNNRYLIERDRDREKEGRNIHRAGNRE